jgi:hypothetical protein|tara:strand:- start:662 stop:838 length:177 start_codon:yes stop_codon:yes gene_type:complete
LICFTGFACFSGRRGIITAVWHIGMIHITHAVALLHRAIHLMALRIANIGENQRKTKQ